MIARVSLRFVRRLGARAALAAIAGAVATPAAPAASAAFAFATEADAAAWEPWSPREEIAPRFSFEPGRGRDGRGALRLAADRPADHGAWRTMVSGLRPGETYRFSAWYRPSGVAWEERSVIARLQWTDAAGQPVRTAVRPPEYPGIGRREGGWTELARTLTAPEGAAGLEIRLGIAFAPGGQVDWDEVVLNRVEPEPGRTVRVATVRHRPAGNRAPAANVEEFVALARKAGPERPDLICLPEGITVVGTGRRYADVSEPVPGPTTDRLGEVARELRAYVVAGLFERVGETVYNTAVLLDREGRVAGRYRKTHLPREEVDGGLTPGDAYPVFDTDFGRIALLVCWDLQFPEPWRAVALQGAELVLMPTWGGTQPLLAARAIENHVHVVSSGYNFPSAVVSPTGETLGEAPPGGNVVVVEVALDRTLHQPGLGDMSTRTWKERRADLPVGPR